ncbi:MAG: hypothetical protein HFG71_15310 [Hungatella sp.]|jgi:hypothetical protein|nr:hypothetical protein [Hungatella sp.]
MAKKTAASIQADIAKGAFRPHTALSNMALAYFQSDAKAFAKTIFPICPVTLSSDNYYVFDKEDLLRDNWQRKPAYGKVDPAVLSEHTESYACVVDQMIMGIDRIRQTDLTRRQGPGAADPRMQRARTMAGQANIHQDVLFSKAFFRPGVWGHEETGVDSTIPTSGQFIKFSNGNSDPVALVDDRKTVMEQSTGRTPNRMAIGVNVFNTLKKHPAILERVKYGGTTANPATITENVLSQLFGIERLTVQRSVMNRAKLGQKADMRYIGDPNGFLLAYATDTPSIDEPSAGYIFTWDMLGNGNIMPILNYDGESGTHSEFIEGLMATDMKKTADDLGMFFADAV